MINISKNRDLDSIADAWASDVIAFLTDDLSDKKEGHKPGRGRPRKVKTRMMKYEQMFGEKCRTNGVSEDEWKNAWSRLKPYLINRDKLIALPDSLVTEKDVDIFNGDDNIKKATKETFTAIYNSFTGLKAYDYMEKLKIRTCPYCNRHYTFTVRKNKAGFSTRPEYDHYHDKKTYPHLALAFYNLIPSCRECNHNKRNVQLNIHPYKSPIESKFVIMNKAVDKELDLDDILALKSAEDFEIRFRKEDSDVNIRERYRGNYSDPSDEESKNIRTLGLEDLYNGHKDYVLELIEKRNSYDLITREGIVDGFQGIFHTQGEVFEFIWGRYLEENTFEKQPLSKFTHDILIQLGLLK